MKVRNKLMIITVLAIAIVMSQVTCRKTQILDVSFEGELKIAFGSCYGWRNLTNDIFRTINQNHPHLWIWLGDAAYADRKGYSYSPQYEEHVKSRFNATKYEDQFYNKFIKEAKVIGVWDDHDYGTGNGDKSFIGKDRVKDIFLDFIDEPKGSDRLEEGKGIYQDYVIQNQDFKVHIILLDVRYDYDSELNDRLGNDQLQWLEEKLSENQDSDITLIGNGIQILPDRNFKLEEFSWENKRKLFSLINKYKKSGVIFLSGDVHFAQIYQSRCQSLTGYNILEMTSSGMTHSAYTQFHCPNIALDFITPSFWTASEIINDFNFGMIKIGRSRKDSQLSVTLQVIDINNEVRLEKVINVEENLRFNTDILRYSIMCNQIHAFGNTILSIANYAEVLILKRSFVLYGDLIALLMAVSLLISSILRILKSISTKFL